MRLVGLTFLYIIKLLESVCQTRKITFKKVKRCLKIYFNLFEYFIITDERSSLFQKADSDKIPCWTDTVQLNVSLTSLRSVKVFIELLNSFVA